jgi:mannosylglycerate hydrolase
MDGNVSSKLTMYYFASTHWDREWYESFQGFRFRLVNVVKEIVDVLERDDRYAVFHMDGQTIVLEDVLEVVPELRQRLERLIQQGRLLIGPWYVMPDEYLLSGESLIRNLVKGHRVSKEWGVEAWKYGYICDIFGHIAQMPQIFNGFGIRHAMLGRGTNEHTLPAHFRWQSPDDSELTTFKLPDQQGYGAFCKTVHWRIQEEGLDEAAADALIREHIEAERARSPVPVVVVMDGMDHEPIHPETPDYVERMRRLFPEADVKLVDALDMGRQVDEYRAMMPVRRGELNEPAKVKAPYIHLITHTLSSRYPHKQANDECQILLEKWVQPLLAVATLEGLRLPKAYVEMAYTHLLQNHPHDSICGCSIDQVHRDMEYRFDQAKEVGGLVRKQALRHLLPTEAADAPGGALRGASAGSATRSAAGEASGEVSWRRVLAVVNPLPFPRAEVMTVDIDFPRGYPCTYAEPFGYEMKNSFKIYNAAGEEVPYGLVSIRNNWKMRRYDQVVGVVDRYTIALQVEAPALGMAEYTVEPYEAASRYLQALLAGDREAENEFLRLRIRDNGTLCVTDKRTGRVYDQLGGYVDDGEIGDGWYHANPAEDRLVSSGGGSCEIHRVESNAARTVFEVRQTLAVPREVETFAHGMRRSYDMAELTIVSRVELAKGAKHVAVETTVVNTARDHRLRLVLPTGVASETYFSNQAFAFVERATGVRAETQSWKECEVPEKPMAGIAGRRRDDGTGLAFVSAYGLHECAASDDEAGTLAVTLFRSFRRTVMTNGEEGGQLLGELTFRYALAVLEPGTSYADLTRLQDVLQTPMHGETRGVSAAEAVGSAAAGKAAMGPVSYLALSASDIVMSTLKLPESGEPDRIIVRLVNLYSERASATLTCYRRIVGVEELNLNEEVQSSRGHDGNTLEISMEPWKIATFGLWIKSDGEDQKLEGE